MARSRKKIHDRPRYPVRRDEQSVEGRGKELRPSADRIRLSTVYTAGPAFLTRGQRGQRFLSFTLTPLTPCEASLLQDLV